MRQQNCGLYHLIFCPVRSQQPVVSQYWYMEQSLLVQYSHVLGYLNKCCRFQFMILPLRIRHSWFLTIYYGHLLCHISYYTSIEQFRSSSMTKNRLGFPCSAQLLNITYIIKYCYLQKFLYPNTKFVTLLISQKVFFYIKTIRFLNILYLFFLGTVYHFGYLIIN